MAGSLNHIVDEDGLFNMEHIENLGDAHEALEECFEIIRYLTGGTQAALNPVLRLLYFPQIKADMEGERPVAETRVMWAPCVSGKPDLEALASEPKFAIAAGGADGAAFMVQCMWNPLIRDEPDHN